MATSSVREDWMCHNAERFVRFDTIRVCKLYELMQYTLITIPIAWLGNSLVMLFLQKYAQNPDKYSVGQLIFTIIVAVMMIVVLAYYIPKLVVIVAPLFPFQGSGYKPSMKGESMIGIGTAFGMFFYGSMVHFGSIVTNIGERIYPTAWKV